MYSINSRGRIVFLLLAVPQFAHSMPTRPVRNTSATAIGSSGLVPSAVDIEIAGGDLPEAMPSFGGYVNNSTGLTSTAANGAGMYVVGGYFGSQGYVALHNSTDHSRICKTTFQLIDPSPLQHVYDQTMVFGVAFAPPGVWGNGAFYAVGQALDTTAIPNNRDGFIQGFDPSCQPWGPAVIVGGPDDDGFSSIGVNLQSDPFPVAVGGWLHVEGSDQFLAGKFAADLMSDGFLFYYPFEGLTGGNRFNAVTVAPIGDVYAAGYAGQSPDPTGRLPVIVWLRPNGDVGDGASFSDRGPSEVKSIQLDIDGTLSIAGPITGAFGGPFGVIYRGIAPDLTTTRCGIYDSTTVAAELAAVNAAYAGVDVTKLPAFIPSQQIILVNPNCGVLVFSQPFGSTNGAVIPGGLTFDSLVNKLRIVDSTTGTDYTPNTDGTILMGTQNGHVAEFNPQ